MTTEQWKEFFPADKLKFRYAISNFGRLKSFTDKIEEGTLLKGNKVNGYRVFRYKIRTEKGVKSINMYIHRLIAECFLPREDHQTHVIFLNHNKKTLHVSNLKWVTYAELMQHNAQSPAYKTGRETAREKNMQRDGHKLTENDVILLKRKLARKNTRVKMLAKSFNVSETTIYRIARNENWGHVKAFEDR